MTERRQKIRGTTLQLDQEIGLEGLLAYDIEKKSLRVYDGILVGGYKIPNATEIAALYTLPTRLGATGISITGAARSANEALDSGYYWIDGNVTDIPVAGQSGTLHAIRASNGQISQTWVSNVDAAEWTRRRTAALVWSAWVRQVDLPYLTSNAAAKAYDADRLDGQDSSYYTAIAARLGYTPANKAGDTFTGPVTVGGAFATTGAATIGGTLGVNGNEVVITGASPRVLFIDNTANAHNFWAYADSNKFYILTDRNGGTTWQTPYPMELRNDTAAGYLYGAGIWTTANDGPGSGLDADTVDGLQGNAFARATSGVTAGNGLTGGGTFGSGGTVPTIAMGTPGTLTGSTGNTVGATNHTHNVDSVNVVAAGLTAAVYNGSSTTNINYPISSVVAYGGRNNRNAVVDLRLNTDSSEVFTDGGSGTKLTGTWRHLGRTSSGESIACRTL